MHVQLGQIMDNKIQKDQKNPTATSEELGAKTGCQGQNQGTAHAPCTQHHQRVVGKPPKSSLWPDPWTHPYCHPIRKQLAPPHLPPWGASKGNCYLFLRPPLLQQGPQ